MLKSVLFAVLVLCNRFLRYIKPIPSPYQVHIKPISSPLKRGVIFNLQKALFVRKKALFLYHNISPGMTRITEIKEYEGNPAYSFFYFGKSPIEKREGMSFLFELGNHLSNIISTVSDIKIQKDDNTDGTVDYYNADITSATDVYPFGMLMPGRNFSSTAYMFGMGGQEKDDEITGITGANYTATYWEYDTRLGRRWNVDPVIDAGQSNYVCFSNSPIIRIDPNGDDDYYNEKGQYLYTDTKTSTDMRLITQVQWDRINNNYSTQIADKNSSYGDLITDLETNSKVVTNNVTSDQIESMWTDSHPEIPIGETIDGNKREEQLSLIVLDVEKAEINLLKQDDPRNNEGESYTSTPLFDRENRTYTDKNLLVIGGIHMHPNKQGDLLLGRNDGAYYNTQPNDVEQAKWLNAPMYVQGYNFAGNGLEIDLNLPSGNSVDTYKAGEEIKNFDLGRDALETFGNKPNP